MKRKFLIGAILLAALVGRGDAVVTNEVTLGGGVGYDFTTLKAACDAIAQSNDWTVVNIRVKADVSAEMAQVRIPANKTIRLLGGAEHGRVGISFSSQNPNFNGSFCIDVPAGSRLEVGGEDSEGSVILRACSNSSGGRLPFSDMAKPLVVVHGENAELKVGVYGELAYGDDVVLVADKAKFTMEGGIIHSGYNCQVFIAQAGEFTLKDGYIMGHYVSSPSDGSSFGKPYNYGDNPIMNPTNVENGVYGGNDQPGKGAVSNYLAGLTFTGPNGKLLRYDQAMTNYAAAVLTTTNGATFRMNGGNICGTMGDSSYSRRRACGVDAQGDLVYGNKGIQSVAVVIDCAKFEMTGGNIYGNYRYASSGGAVMILNSRDPSEAFLNDGIYTNSTMMMTGGRIFCNENADVIGGGGAVRMEGKSTMTMTGGKIDHNVCNGGGGGIRMVSSKLVIDGDAEISGNFGASDNKQISGDPSVHEAYCGGGVAVVCQSSGYGLVASDVQFLGGRVIGNRSGWHGGGITLTDKGNAQERGINVTFGDILVSNNVADVSGGGIYCGGTTSSRLTGGATIVDNVALENGGGVFIDQQATTNAADRCGTVTSVWCRVSGNRAKNGGGIAVVNGNYVSDPDQTGTSLICGNQATHAGGGIYAIGGTLVTNHVEFLGGEISLNSAADGGGVYVTNEVLTATGGNIVSNTASLRGGGMCLSVDSRATFDGTVNISYNVATNLGGGVVMNEKAKLDIREGTFSFNVARMGGGAHLLNGAKLTINGGNFFCNKAVFFPGDDEHETAYASERYQTLAGVGGGIYLGNGLDGGEGLTELICPNDEREGLVGAYSNVADRAGNEIVSSGVNTHVKLPNRVLRDDEGHVLHWFEDYYVGGNAGETPKDTHYTIRWRNAPDGTAEAMRYMKARLTGVQQQVMEDTAERGSPYLCLALGYGISSAVRSLWITDHADAGTFDGTNWVNLAFTPVFDATNKVRVADWFLKARERGWIKCVTAMDEVSLTNGSAWTGFRYRDGHGTNDIGKGWVWLTVPVPDERPASTNRLWKIYVNEEAEVPGHRLEWVSSETNSVLDTGFLPKSTDRIEMEFKFNSVNKIQTLFCARSRNKSAADRGTFTAFAVFSDASKGSNRGWRFDYNGANGNADQTHGVDIGRHTLVASQADGLCVDGTEYASAPTGQSSDFTVGSNLHLFGCINTESIGYGNFSDMTFYSAKVFDVDGNLVLDLVPWQDNNGVAGLYDQVGKRFLKPLSGNEYRPLQPGPAVE